MWPCMASEISIPFPFSLRRRAIRRRHHTQPQPFAVALPRERLTLVVEIGHQPVVEPRQEVRARVPVRQLVRQIRRRRRRTPRQHLTDEGEIADALVLAHRWYAAPVERRLLHYPPDLRDRPAPPVDIGRWRGVPQPGLRRVGP